MKITCYSHGAHFSNADDEFVKCPYYWKATGTTDLPDDSKRDIAEWLFTMPVDKIWLETGWGLSVPLFKGDFVGWYNSLAENVPGYEDMTEEQRQAWQKQMFRKQLNEPKGVRGWLSKLRKK